MSGIYQIGHSLARIHPRHLKIGDLIPDVQSKSLQCSCGSQLAKVTWYLSVALWCTATSGERALKAEPQSLVGQRSTCSGLQGLHRFGREGPKEVVFFSQFCFFFFPLNMLPGVGGVNPATLIPSARLLGLDFRLPVRGAALAESQRGGFGRRDAGHNKWLWSKPLWDPILVGR